MSDKPRFLITTADERSWRTDRPALFLGEWCRLYERRSAWERLDAEVAPEYGWSEGQQDADYAYVRGLYEQLLSELSEALNRHHGVNHSLRYWRILVGPWLYRFTAVAFNRWATIQWALHHHTITGTTVLDFPRERTIARNTTAFIHANMGNVWNHALYGRILGGWTKVPIERVAIDAKVELTHTPAPVSPPALTRRLEQAVAQVVSKLASTLSRPTDAFVIASYLPLKQEIFLQIALGQIPQYWQSPSSPQVPPDLDNRARFGLDTTGHEGFEQCIRMLIPEQIPTCYLEGYTALLNTVSRLPWPRRPKVIFTSNKFDTDEIFKTWTAEKVEEGIPYVIGQHGGNYGTAKYAPSEVHEVATADRYLTWGWTDGNRKHYPAAALKAVGRSGGRWNPAGGLLLVELHGDIRESPWDETSVFKGYLEEQFRFVDALPGHLSGGLVVRLHSIYTYLGWSEDKLWKRRRPDAKLDLGAGKIDSLIGQSRLVVHSYNSTGILETLAQNVPTISFWNTSRWKLRSSAQPWFDRLKQVGIFHESPESAAAKVAEVWDDITGWWNKPEVQEARLLFCERFARLPENPIRLLKEALVTAKPEQDARRIPQVRSR